jgi:hypothetical protein
VAVGTAMLERVVAKNAPHQECSIGLSMWDVALFTLGPFCGVDERANV